MSDIWLHRKTQTVACGDSSTTLSGQEYRVLSCLRHLVPRSTRELIQDLWPNPDMEPDSSKHVIAVVLSSLRRKLPEGLIVSRWVEGYYLSQPIMRRSH